MKVVPKYYLADLDSYERVSPFFNTVERAIAYKKKHHFFANIHKITEKEKEELLKELKR